MSVVPTRSCRISSVQLSESQPPPATDASADGRVSGNSSPGAPLDRSLSEASSNSMLTSATEKLPTTFSLRLSPWLYAIETLRGLCGLDPASDLNTKRRHALPSFVSKWRTTHPTIRWEGALSDIRLGLICTLVGLVGSLTSVNVDRGWFRFAHWERSMSL